MKLTLKSWDNPTSNDRLQLVFANRNQEYGAFTLRRDHEKTVLIAFLSACFIGTLIATSPLIYHRYFTNEDAITEITRSIEYVSPEQEKIEETPEEIPAEKIQEKPDPSPATIKDLVPIIVDRTATDSILPQEILSTVTTGTKTTAGDSTIADVLPIDNGDENKDGGTTKIYDFVEEMPSYPGGDAAMMAYLQRKINYPAIARETNVQGTVYLSFVVDKQGLIRDVTIKRGIGAGCEEEAIRVINSMPAWRPGKSNGRPVFVNYVLPITFSLK
jgi:protein TonB